MKLVFLDTETVGEVPNLKKLEKYGQVDLYAISSYNETLTRIQGKDIVITNKVLLDKKILEQCPDVRLICVAATGTNNVDLDYSAKAGIEVKNVKGYSTNSVAQIAIGMVLYLLNHIRYYDDYVKNGDYCLSNTFTHLGKPYWELNKKRFGIMGLGNIGKKTAAIASAFGAEVVYYSASGNHFDQDYKRLELEEFFRTCDVISIHAPLNEKTLNFINYEKLLMMKPTSILINTGRGGIIHEGDLVRALNENLIAGAGIDVMEKEPIDKNSPLFLIKEKSKVVFAPHIAWSSIEARTLLIDKVCENIESYLAGKG